jgi:hypothetical protein
MEMDSLNTRCRVRMVATLLCLLCASLATAVALAADSSVMRTLIRINWDDPLNIRYVNLGNDQFLFGTRLGVRFWTLRDNEIKEVPFVDGLAKDNLIALDEYWVRLGDAPEGTAFLGSGTGGSRLIWWNAQQSKIAAALQLDSSTDSPEKLVRLDAHTVLACYFKNASAVVAQLQQSATGSTLALAKAEDKQVRKALQRMNVIGNVTGFSKLTADNSKLPVLYNASRCAWEFKDPPQPFKSLLEKYADKVRAVMYPVFFDDGRVLINMAQYHDGQYWRQLNPPLLWQPKLRRWTEIARTRRDGTGYRNTGQPVPVVSHSFDSDVIEFLDESTMTWRRSVETLPENYATAEPLSNGNALVMIQEDSPSLTGIVGQVTPSGGLLPAGKLLQRRSRSDLELSVHGNLILFGDGYEHSPSSITEMIDSSKQQAHTLASWPQLQSSPASVALNDGSILLFGGLPPDCTRESACSLHGEPVSMRYFPEENRWQVLQNLLIPFAATSVFGGDALLRRNDAVVRANGDLVFVDGGERDIERQDTTLTSNSVLKRWNSSHPQLASQPVAPLLRRRTDTSIIELADGRLAAMGGFTQLERVALEKGCIDCPDEFTSIGKFQGAVTTEVLDEATAKPLWRTGPLTNYPGGYALKLANGRIFKVSHAGDKNYHGWREEIATWGFRAEIANAEFTRWQTLPPFPLKGVQISNLTAVGNRIFVLTDKDATVIWDDTLGKWSVLTGWPAHRADDTVVSITATTRDDQVLVRYLDSFAVETVPDQR